MTGWPVAHHSYAIAVTQPTSVKMTNQIFCTREKYMGQKYAYSRGPVYLTIANQLTFSAYQRIYWGAPFYENM